MKIKNKKGTDELQKHLFIVRNNDMNSFTQKSTTQHQLKATMKLLKGMPWLTLHYNFL